MRFPREVLNRNNSSAAAQSLASTTRCLSAHPTRTNTEFVRSSTPIQGNHCCPRGYKRIFPPSTVADTSSSIRRPPRAGLNAPSTRKKRCQEAQRNDHEQQRNDGGTESLQNVSPPNAMSEKRIVHCRELPGKNIRVKRPVVYIALLGIMIEGEIREVDRPVDPVEPVPDQPPNDVRTNAERDRRQNTKEGKRKRFVARQAHLEYPSDRMQPRLEGSLQPIEDERPVSTQTKIVPLVTEAASSSALPSTPTCGPAGSGSADAPAAVPSGATSKAQTWREPLRMHSPREVSQRRKRDRAQLRKPEVARSSTPVQRKNTSALTAKERASLPSAAVDNQQPPNLATPPLLTHPQVVRGVLNRPQRIPSARDCARPCGGCRARHPSTPFSGKGMCEVSSSGTCRRSRCGRERQPPRGRQAQSQRGLSKLPAPTPTPTPTRTSPRSADCNASPATAGIAAPPPPPQSASQAPPPAAPASPPPRNPA